MNENPYRSPQLPAEDAAESNVRCSFCERDAVEAGPLVQSPDKRAFICARCAEVAMQLVSVNAGHRLSRNFALLVALVLGSIAMALAVFG